MSLGSWVTAKYLVRFQEFQLEPATRALLERWSWIGIVLFTPTIYSFIMLQKGPYWLLIVATTWSLLRKRRDGWAGIVFGLLSVKPTLFFLMPIVLLRYGHWKFFLGASLSVMILWGGTYALLPIEVWSGFVSKFGMSSSYAAIQGYHLDWACGLISLSQVSDVARNVELLKWFFVLPLCLYGLLVVTQPRRLDIDDPNTLWSLLVVTFLLSPHTYYYDLVLLLIPLLWLAAIEPRRSIAYYFLLVAAIVLSPLVLETVGLPLIPIVLVGTLFEQRMGRFALNRQTDRRIGQVRQNEELAY
jgi:hypothetical protein